MIIKQLQAEDLEVRFTSNKRVLYFYYDIHLFYLSIWVTQQSVGEDHNIVLVDNTT